MINYQRFHVNPPTKPTISQTTCSLGGSELRDTRAASAVNQSLSLHNDLGDLTRAEANAIIDRSCGDVVSPSVGLSIWNTNSMTSSGWWFNYMFLFTLYILIDICFPHLDSFDI